MIRSPEVRQAVRARLEWLRLLGIEDLAVRRQAGSGSPSAGAGTVAAEAVQVSLFGGASGDAPAPSVSARRGKGRAEGTRGSPLDTVPVPQAPDASAALRLIREEIGDCTRCRLCEKRTNVVFGVGDPNASLMFIGEGPGVDEDRQGEPFVGRAGQLLTRIIESMGYAREQVYIANIVKCRPPENRTPLPDEIATCSPFLFQQIKSIRPRVIVCLGTPAAQTLLGTRETITRLRGSFHEAGGFKVMPTFHPAYLLRNPGAKKEVWEDMKKVLTYLRTPR